MRASPVDVHPPTCSLAGPCIITPWYAALLLTLLSGTAASKHRASAALAWPEYWLHQFTVGGTLLCRECTCARAASIKLAVARLLILIEHCVPSFVHRSRPRQKAMVNPGKAKSRTKKAREARPHNRPQALWLSQQRVRVLPRLNIESFCTRFAHTRAPLESVHRSELRQSGSRCWCGLLYSCWRWRVSSPLSMQDPDLGGGGSTPPNPPPDLVTGLTAAHCAGEPVLESNEQSDDAER